jgi:hypothetical protein
MWTDFQPGDRVRFRGYSDLGYGTVTENCPGHGGCLVRPDGQERAGGFGYQELELVLARTAWERIVGPNVDFG